MLLSFSCGPLLTAAIFCRTACCCCCSAKNPDNKGRGGVPSAGPEPEYTKQQRQQFQGRSWVGLEDRSLLDVAGTELLLVGAKDDPIGIGMPYAVQDASFLVLAE
jgi:hypothetical protein